MSLLVNGGFVTREVYFAVEMTYNGNQDRAPSRGMKRVDSISSRPVITNNLIFVPRLCFDCCSLLLLFGLS